MKSDASSRPLKRGYATLSAISIIALLHAAPAEAAMFARHYAPHVPQDCIAVMNAGDEPLLLSYWDGEGKWVPLSISSGRETLLISCAKCGSEINVSFHDGAENRIIAAKTMRAYVIFWNSEAQRWNFDLYEVVIRKLQKELDASRPQ
jgi:hypothetical protein